LHLALFFLKNNESLNTNMKNPLLNRKHLKEYFLVGLIAAALYSIPGIWFLYNKNYENSYYLFIGCFLFMIPIFIYTLALSKRQYEGRRSASMLMAGHFATMAGMIIAAIFISASIWFFFPHGSNGQPEVIANVPDNMHVPRPAGLLGLMLSTALIGNFAVGSFICVLLSYAAKRDQRNDEPVPLEN
jgi:hypothetical protein